MQNIADKVVASGTRLHWYCSECRKTSVSQLSFRMTRISDEFIKLTKRFVEMPTSFQSLQEHFVQIGNFPSDVEATEDSFQDDNPLMNKAYKGRLNSLFENIIP